MVIAGLFSAIMFLLIGFSAGLFCAFFVAYKYSKWKEKKTKEYINEKLKHTKTQPENNKEYTINDDGSINVDAEIIN